MKEDGRFPGEIMHEAFYPNPSLMSRNKFRYGTDVSPACERLENVHSDSAPYCIIPFEYSAFQSNYCPLGFWEFQKGEKVFDRRPIWNFNLNTL